MTGRRMMRAALILMISLAGIWSASEAGNINIPPKFTWVGPDSNCDYPSLQEAIDGEQPCRFCAPPAGGEQFRLSDEYLHSGEVTIGRSLSVVGGFDTCGAVFNGVPKTIVGIRFVIGDPGGSDIDVALGHLELNGSGSVFSRGGVIEMTGGVSLTLENSRVRQGLATQGGGIAMHGAGNDLILDSSIIESNEAVEEGGGIWCADFGDIEFISGSIRDNQSQRRGGGVFLQDCDLRGETPGQNRYVEDNTVLHSDPGKGGGIYLHRTSSLTVGAADSRTVIDGNEVLQDPPVEFSDGFGNAVGGGIHAEDGRVTLRNVHLLNNVAPAGAAISAGVGSRIDIDRLSGDCPNGATLSGVTECSLIANNVANGLRTPDNGLPGDGAVFYGRAREWTLRRTTVRGNIANCATRDCNDPDSGSMFHVLGGANSGTATFRIEQSLIVDSFVDSHCTGFCDVRPVDDRRVGMIEVFDYDRVDLIRNTITGNEFRDYTDNDVDNFMMRTNGDWRAVGNILHDNKVEKLMDRNRDYGGGTGTLAEAFCNVSAYRSLLEDSELSVGNVREDPLFQDSESGDYRIQLGSPAVNLCSEDLVGPESYDLAGRLSPREGDESSGSLGDIYDAGSLEHQSGSADEVDLSVSVFVQDSGDIQGQVFEFDLGNFGLTAAAAGNFSLTFPDSDRVLQQDQSWTCDAPGTGLVARCTSNFLDILDPMMTAPPLVLRVLPDFAGDCELEVSADPGDQPDVNLSDNSATGLIRRCGLGELVFRHGFEGSAQP
ncbi:MAG: hypothetical protein QNJ40_02485 [Xanthomonadales bacterium]|nr:hypothetical protein [Xanthomonadales bacterium]